MHVTRLIGPTVCAVTIYSKVHDATPRTSLGETTDLLVVGFCERNGRGKGSKEKGEGEGEKKGKCMGKREERRRGKSEGREEEGKGKGKKKRRGADELCAAVFFFLRKTQPCVVVPQLADFGLIAGLE